VSFNKKCNTLQQLAKSIKAYTTVDTTLYAQAKKRKLKNKTDQKKSLTQGKYVCIC